MIEVDVFWSFAFGAAFASAAAWELRSSPSCWVNAPFVYTLFFLSAIFAPSGIYLLWQFPGWESMWLLGDKNTIHAILPTLFSCTNVLLGMLGFRLAYNSIRSGNELFAHTLWIGSYTCFSAILGMGYARFLYAGDHVQWAQGVHFPLTAWFGGEVFFTLLAMGVVLLPAYFVPCVQWFNTGLRARGIHAATHRSLVLQHVRNTFLVCTVFVCVLYIGYVHTVATNDMHKYLEHGPFSFYAPLVGFLVAQLVVSVIASIPLLVSSAPRGKAE